jgi:hypothetical protein
VKSRLIAFLSVLLFGTLALAWAKTVVRGETLSGDAAQSRWGNDVFQVKKFREGAIDSRAAMAASLIAGKAQFIGLDRAEIRKRLGDYSGHYISGMYPTYLIQETSESSTEAWQLVFLIDKDGKVRDVIIHKNCCSPELFK